MHHEGALPGREGPHRPGARSRVARLSRVLVDVTSPPLPSAELSALVRSGLFAPMCSMVSAIHSVCCSTAAGVSISAEEFPGPVTMGGSNRRMAIEPSQPWGLPPWRERTEKAHLHDRRAGFKPLSQSAVRQLQPVAARAQREKTQHRLRNHSDSPLKLPKPPAGTQGGTASFGQRAFPERVELSGRRATLSNRPVDLGKAS